MKTKIKYFFGLFLVTAVLATSLIPMECACRKKKAVEQITP